MNDKTRIITSICLKFALAICAILGLVLCFIAGGFMGGKTLLLYFTVQSNIWIALVDIVLAIMQIKALRGGKYSISEKSYIVQQVFTVSITLTGFIYCFVLLPAFLSSGNTGFNVFEPSQMLLHVATPVLALVDFIGFTRVYKIKPIKCLFAALPPLYYLFFSMFGYFNNWNFGGGANYPYFFLNYGSPAGIFGFSKVMPYFMGSGYWIAAIVVFVLLVSFLLIKLVNRMINKLPVKI